MYFRQHPESLPTYRILGGEAGLCGFAGIQVLSSGDLTLGSLVLHNALSRNISLQTES